MKINHIELKSNVCENSSFYRNNAFRRNYKFQSKSDVTKFDSISFGMRINYGTPATLPDVLQTKIQNIHENIDFIRNFFDKHSKNPQLCSLIKKGYPDLISRKNTAIMLKLPDSDSNVEIMRSITRDSVLYISINDNSQEFNGIVIDGKDKLIANYLKRHPHMLPRGIKYMNEAMMKEAEPEKFINTADERLQSYYDYIKKLENGELPMPKVIQYREKKTPLTKELLDTNKASTESLEAKTDKTIKIKKNNSSDSVKKEQNKQNKKTPKLTKFIDRDAESKNKPVHKPQKHTTAEFADYIAEKTKNITKNITQFLNEPSNEFPNHITPISTSSGTIPGFSLKTDDGGSLTVVRKVVGSYGSSMPYLSFKKENPDGTMNFISIDLITNKILRTKEKGKPHISNDHIVYELTPDEIKKRKIEEKLDSYIEQIYRKNENENIQNLEETNPITENDIAKDNIDKSVPVVTDNILQPELTGFNTDKIKEDMQRLGKEDGRIAANEYFNAFKEQFIQEIKQKMSEFNANIHNLLDSLSK